MRRILFFGIPIRKSDYLKNVESKLSSMTKVQVGLPIPRMELEDKHQNKVSSHDFSKAKITLIDLWATWCAPCIATHPKLKQLYDVYNKKGFEIVGISMDEDKNKWASFLANNPLPWRNYIDPKGIKGDVDKTFSIVGHNGIPYFILLNQKGEFLQIDVDVEELENIIRSNL